MSMLQYNKNKDKPLSTISDVGHRQVRSGGIKLVKWVPNPPQRAVKETITVIDKL